MQAFPFNYDVENKKLSHSPIYVFEILWAGGLHGVEGVNDVYFGTSEITDIVNFPYPGRYFPYLKADSISSISHKVDPISGVSTIGGISVTLQDYQGTVSDIIQAADIAGHGLRRQRVEVYVLFKGMDWADKVKIRTMQVKDLRLSSVGEYKLSCSDIQRNLQKTIFSPVKTTVTTNIAASGAVAVTVPDNSIFHAVANQAYGTSGFLKMKNGEMLQWTTKTATTTLNVPASGRGMFGTTAEAHTAGDEVQEIVVIRENPITLALKVLQSSGVAGAKGTYDVYPEHWGCSLDSTLEVDEAGWLQLGVDLAGLVAGAPLPSDGYQFEFVFDRGIEAKKFIESDILKVLGGFGFVTGKGLYSSRVYSDLANADKGNATLHIARNNAIKWGDLQYDYSSMANELLLDYVESPRLSGKYIRTAVFVDTVSKKKWGDAKQLRYTVSGAIGTAAYVEAMYQRFQRVMARYSRPPMKMKITLMPHEHGVEIGDSVRVTLPIRDLVSGADLDRAFEVLSVNLIPKTGEVLIECIAQPEKVAFWFNGVGQVASVSISPVSVSMVTGTTLQMVARAFDANGNQVAWPSIIWTTSGNITVDANGLITAGIVGSGSVYASIGGVNSNTAAVEVTATPSAGVVAAVSVSPASISLEAGGIQNVVAQSFDAFGTELAGKSYTWASSDQLISSVPAGPSSSAVVTAVANGLTNITATETSSLVVSPDVVTTVSQLPTPVYTPPTIADSVYQVGTKITAHGPVGGPHIIPNGYNFPSGDYWYDGDVSLSVGDSCTINGSTRIFSTGTVTINGTVNGLGRGLPGGVSGTASRLINAPGGFIWGIADGNPGSSTGITGRGGAGGNNKGDANAGYVQFNLPAPGGWVSNASGITIQVLPILPADGSVPWTQVAGIPSNLPGSGGGSGGAIHFPDAGGAKGGTGGAGGSGLLIMARGLFITGTGLVDLRGGSGAQGVMAGPRPSQCGGGGGGGGTFVGLVERDTKGIANMVVDANRVFLAGGAGALSTGWYLQTHGAPGGSGEFKPQVIG